MSLTGSDGGESVAGIGRSIPEIVNPLRRHLERFWAVWLVAACLAVAAAFGLQIALERLLSGWVHSMHQRHGFLVVGMAAWLLFLRLRGDGTVERVGPSWAGFVLLLAATLLYTLFAVLDLSRGMAAAVPLVLLASVFALAGPQFARLLVLPVGMLYFAIPVWDLTTVPLQNIATAVVTVWLRWTGITAHIDGYFITIWAGTFEIAQGCSGKRYFVASLALASFYAFAWLRFWSTRLLLIAAAAFAAMVSNWIRIYTLVLIGEWTAMEHYLIQVSHDAYGWIIFLAAMAPVLYLANRLELDRAGVALQPRERGFTRVHRVASAPSVLLSGLAAALIVASPAFFDARSHDGAIHPAQPERVSLVDEPSSGWMRARVSPHWDPRYQGAQFIARESFVSADGVQVDVFMARYSIQRPQARVISRWNTLSPGWRSAGAELVETPVADSARLVQASDLRAGGTQRVLWNWYIVGGRPAHNAGRARLTEAAMFLVGRRDAAVIAVSALCEESCVAAQNAMREFLELHGALMEAVASGDVDATSRQVSAGGG